MYHVSYKILTTLNQFYVNKLEILANIVMFYVLTSNIVE